MHDKLAIFRKAGYDTDGWDYAIPQTMFDELLKMGMEIQPYFVADCSAGVSVKLRHAGEALFDLLQQRSDMNGEFLLVLVNETDDQGKALVQYINDRPFDNQIYNEADSGFLDLQLIVSAFNAGWVQAERRATKHIMESPTIIREGYAPLKVVLRTSPTRDDEWVTHMLNLQTGGYDHGHYFASKNDAIEDYLVRCKKNNIQPF